MPSHFYRCTLPTSSLREYRSRMVSTSCVEIMFGTLRNDALILFSPQRVTHSVLCTRVLLRIFNSAHNPDEPVTFTGPSIIFSVLPASTTTTSTDSDDSSSMRFGPVHGIETIGYGTGLSVDCSSGFGSLRFPPHASRCNVDSQCSVSEA